MLYRPSSPRVRGRSHARRSRFFRPALETLEDRMVPSGSGWLIDADPSGTVFRDTNANGKFDTGETGLAGWTVWLDLSGDGVIDPGEPVMTTDSTGHYAFDTTNVPPALIGSNGDKGDLVRFDLPVGSGGRWLNTTATSATIDRTTTPNATGVDFGVIFQPTVGVGPAGPEFLVNATTAGQQGTITRSDVTASADTAGDYVVAWRTFVNGTDIISARVFNADGSARTGEITVATTTTTTSQVIQLPKVAMAGNGRFAVIWQSYDNTLGVDSIFAKAYTLDGTAASATMPVVVGSSTVAVWPLGAAADATGNFAVLYATETHSKNWGWSGPTFKVQRCTATGAANGGAISVVSPSLINGNASFGMAGAGNFVVVWDDVNHGASYVYAQQFTAAGHSSGKQITVASGGTTGASGMTLWSSVAMNANGRFVVTYEDSGTRVARVYNADGTPAGAAVTFASGGVVDGEPAAVALDGAGNATFAWTSIFRSSDYEPGQVRMVRLTAAGVVGTETIVNTTTQGNHAVPRVAATGAGTFVIAWQGYGPGDDAGIFLQRFASAPQVGSFTANASTVVFGSPLTLTASNFNDPNAGATITQVAFYATDSTGNQYLLGYGTKQNGVWTLTVSVNLPPGSYTLFAEATDSLGVLGADSLLLTLTVQ
jgi:hypothetical protein